MDEDVATAYLIGIRLREPLMAEDYLLTDLELHVGDFCVVETGGSASVGQVKRPRRPLPEFKKDRLYRRVLRAATAEEAEEWRQRRKREVRGVETSQRLARSRGLQIKIVDVAIEAASRRVTVAFNSEERVDFRDLVRDLAHEFHARIEMKQIGARDTTKLMDGIGPCGRQLCCSSHLKKFDPISVKMAKGQDMPLTDSRRLGKVGSACQAECGGSGCMTGRIKSLRVLKQAVVVGFQDGTEAEVPLDQVTWEGRPHIKPE